MPEQAAFSESVRKWLDLFPIQPVWMAVDKPVVIYPIADPLLSLPKWGRRMKFGVYEYYKYVYPILVSQYILLLFQTRSLIYEV